MNDDPDDGDRDLLMTLALSLLDSPLDARKSYPRLFPGQVPEHVPLEIPVSPHSRVLGTLLRSSTRFVIALESTLTLDEALAFYREQFAALAWNEAEYRRMPPLGGFLHSDSRPSVHLTLCQTSRTACLRVTMVSYENATTQVRLDLSLDQQGNPCVRQDQSAASPALPRHRRTPQQTLPTLIPPPGAHLDATSGGGSPRGMHTTSPLTTSLSQEAVAHHYAEQLILAHWTQTASGTGGPLVWSTWQFTSTVEEPRQWTGLFFILKMLDEPDHYTIYLQATWPRPETDH